MQLNRKIAFSYFHRRICATTYNLTTKYLKRALKMRQPKFDDNNSQTVKNERQSKQKEQSKPINNFEGNVFLLNTDIPCNL